MHAEAKNSVVNINANIGFTYFSMMKSVVLVLLVVTRARVESQCYVSSGKNIFLP